MCTQKWKAYLFLYIFLFWIWRLFFLAGDRLPCLSNQKTKKTGFPFIGRRMIVRRMSKDLIQIRGNWAGHTQSTALAAPWLARLVGRLVCGLDRIIELLSRIKCGNRGKNRQVTFIVWSTDFFEETKRPIFCKVDTGRVKICVLGSVLGIFRSIPSHNTGTTPGPHQIPRFLYFILDNNPFVR